jgi:hypothetical protein
MVSLLHNRMPGMATPSSSNPTGTGPAGAGAETTDLFVRNVQASCSRLLENYRNLLKRAQISEDHSVQRHEELQINVCAESIVSFVYTLWHVSMYIFFK